MDPTWNEIVIENVEITYIMNYTSFGVLAFLVYDTALLFDDEVKFFVQPRKTALSYLYFVTRYSGVLVMIAQLIFHDGKATTKSCRLSYLITVLEPLLVLCIDYILLLRVRALYQKGKVITIILNIAFAIEVLSGIALGIQGTIPDPIFAMELMPGYALCFQTITGLTEDVVSWSIPLVYGVLLMILAVYKSAVTLKEEPGLNTVNIIRIIIRDQVVYFMALIFISTSSVMGDFIPSSTAVLIVEGSLGTPAILSSVGARLLLNMKDAGEKGLNEGMGSGASRATVSGLDFAEPPAQSSVISRTGDEEDVIEEIEETGA